MARRIEIDNTRAPLIAKLFDWYVSGEYSLRAVTAKAYAAGLTHPRSGRPMMNRVTYGHHPRDCLRRGIRYAVADARSLAPHTMGIDLSAGAICHGARVPRAR
jgi:hypothetical protein